jgi:hypothetical protein
MLIILFTTGYVKLYYREGSSSDVLQKAFKASGAKFISSEIYVWGKYEDQNISFNELTKIIDNLALDVKTLKNDKFIRRIIKNDLIDKIEIIGTIENGSTVNVSAQINRENMHLPEVYISVSINGESPDVSVDNTCQNIIDMFEKYKVHPKVNSCITGCFDGNLAHDDLNKISKHVLKDAQAKKVNGISDNNLISVSAYSPYIDDVMEIGGEKINMNLAIRYNSYEEKTYIWLASPVITTEY